MVVSFEFISAKQLVNEYESYSDTTLVGELQDCTYSLAFGPVLILSAIALQRLRKPRSSAPSYSVKRLRTIILAQMIFITLRFACRTVQKVFKDTRYFFMDDESIQKLTYVSIINVELGLGGVAMFSARAVELLASAVLVCRACAFYPDLFWVRSILVFAWLIDLAVEVFYFAAFMANILSGENISDLLQQLPSVALYASRWTSIALNLLVTSLIAYQAWCCGGDGGCGRVRKFKNVLADSGLNSGKSVIYHILARLVETRALLLAVQLLVAILATTYSTFDPSNPGFVAMIVLAELSLIVLNAHPAAISLVSADILSKEGEGSRDVESAGVSSNMVFRVAETQLSTAPPGGVVSSFHAEK